MSVLLRCCSPFSQIQVRPCHPLCYLPVWQKIQFAWQREDQRIVEDDENCHRDVLMWQDSPDKQDGLDEHLTIVVQTTQECSGM